jgi:hypothetical protein
MASKNMLFISLLWPVNLGGDVCMDAPEKACQNANMRVLAFDVEVRTGDYWWVSIPLTDPYFFPAIRAQFRLLFRTWDHQESQKIQ